MDKDSHVTMLELLTLGLYTSQDTEQEQEEQSLNMQKCVWQAHACTSALKCPINVNQVDTTFVPHRV